MIYLKTDSDYLFFKNKEDSENWLSCQETEPTIIEEGDAKNWFNERFIKPEKINLMMEKKELIKRKEEILKQLVEIEIKLQSKSLTEELPTLYS